MGYGHISIYAPRTGSDGGAESAGGGRADFNLRSPHGERPRCRPSRPAQYPISIYAPRTGSDRWACSVSCCTSRISIYAPRTGSDRKGFPLLIAVGPISIYAPRTGSDWARTAASATSMHFNLRSPHGERPAGPPMRDSAAKISIYAPRTGSDDLGTADGHTEHIFQSTLPARGATRGTQQRGAL